MRTFKPGELRSPNVLNAQRAKARRVQAEREAYEARVAELREEQVSSAAAGLPEVPNDVAPTMRAADENDVLPKLAPVEDDELPEVPCPVTTLMMVREIGELRRAASPDEDDSLPPDPPPDHPAMREDDANGMPEASGVRVAQGNAEPLGRVMDPKRPPYPWMRSFLWVKKSEGIGENKVEWYAPKACAANAITILTHDERWEGVLARNDFAEADITHKLPPWHEHEAVGASTGPWTDPDTTRLGAWFDRAYGMALKEGALERVVSVAAEARRFHPVRDYLRGLKWDGKQRLPTMLATYFGALDTPYSREIGKRWMIGAVARVMRPGCQNDCTMVFEGEQGIGKNRAVRALVPDPEWYSETRIEIGTKDGFQNLRGKWIYLLDELDSLKRADLSRVKNFLTSPRDTYRESYGRRARDFQRQVSFAGTTNEDEWLTDTSNRRFWPVKVIRAPDHIAIAHERDQLWAEALARFDSNEPWHVDTPELRRLCEEQQGDRVQKDVWLPKIAAWLHDPVGWTWEETGQGGRAQTRFPVDLSKGVLPLDVALYALEKPLAQVTPTDEHRITRALAALGYCRGPQHRENGARVRRWTVTTRHHDDNENVVTPQPPETTK